LRVELRESQTKVLLDEAHPRCARPRDAGVAGGGRRARGHAPFDDPFLLAVPAGDPRPRSVSVNVDGSIMSG